MAVFMSTFTNKVDRKGRVSVPSSFRAALGGSRDQEVTIAVFRSFKAQMLECWSIERMHYLAQQMETVDQFSDEYDDLSNLFGEARELTTDPEGRIVLPQELLDFAGITEAANFVGAGPTFQIWEPGRHEAAKAASRERARERGLVLPGRKPAPSLTLVKTPETPE